MTRAELVEAWRIARRELREGLKGFRIFLACLVLGVAAIASVGSLSTAFLEGIAHQSRALLGGDVVVGLTHRPIEAEERAFLARWGEVSAVAEMQAMARPLKSDARTIIELKSVDERYPLFGEAVLSRNIDLAQVLALDSQGRWGAAADPLLMDRLNLRVGDVVKIGAAEFEIRAALEKEPDAAAGLYTLGPRVIAAEAALAETGLVTLGSLIRHTYRMRLDDRTDEALDRFTTEAESAFPQAGWRITDRRSAAPRLKGLIDRISVYLTFVGLTALVVGGIGVGNAVRAFLHAKTDTIATLKCLGAKSDQIFVIYLFEIIVFAALAVGAGLALGAGLPFVLRGALSGLLPIDITPRLYPLALLKAVFYGFLTATLFTLEPLGRARDLPPAALFRSLLGGERAALPKPVFAAIILAVALLAVSAISFTKLHVFATCFVLGAGIVFALLRGLGALIVYLARRAPRPAHVGLRLALANLHRPGAPTGAVVLSLGFGLTLLGALALIGGNLHAQIAGELPRNVPALFMIDIQKRQAEAFDELVRASPGVSEVSRVANIRGRIVRVGDRPAEDVTPKPGSAWLLRGDQGLTYAITVPEGSTVVAGDWWPADYRGPPLLSLYEGAAQGLGLEVGDTLTVNILGREVTAKIANLREIDWSYFGFNYVIVYAPGVLGDAPFNFVANVRVTPEDENALYVKVTDAFPNVSVVRSRDAIGSILKILDQLALGVGLTSLVALTAGALVLAGALAAGYRARVYDSVVLKVVGATRWRLLSSYLIEFAGLGAVAGMCAAVLASAIAFLTVRFVMGQSWVFLPASLAATLAVGVVVTAGLGLIATFRALGERPAIVLRGL